LVSPGSLRNRSQEYKREEKPVYEKRRKVQEAALTPEEKRGRMLDRRTF
jgi:hypothetical protein